MASADINRLMDNARIRLPGALDKAIQIEIFTVLNRFFQGSNVWEEDIPFDVTPTTLPRVTNPDAYTYELTPSEGTIVRLLAIRDTNGFPQHGEMAIPGQLVLTHSPNTATTYTATVSKTVTDPTDRQGYPIFPAWVLDRYGDPILDGVLGQMMSQLAKPYSSPQMAQYHLRRFEAGVARAGTEAQHKNIMGGQTWRFPQTFTRRRFGRI